MTTCSIKYDSTEIFDDTQAILVHSEEGSYPHLLRVFETASSKVPIGREDFYELASRLTAVAATALIDEAADPEDVDNDFVRFNDSGYAAVACTSDRSKKWWLRTIAELSIGGKQYRGWSVGESQQHCVTAFLPRHVTFPIEQVMKTFWKLNPGLGGSLDFRCSANEEDGQRMFFIADDEFVLNLASRGNCLKFVVGQIKFSLENSSL